MTGDFNVIVSLQIYVDVWYKCNRRIVFTHGFCRSPRHSPIGPASVGILMTRSSASLAMAIAFTPGRSLSGDIPLTVSKFFAAVTRLLMIIWFVGYVFIISANMESRSAAGVALLYGVNIDDFNPRSSDDRDTVDSGFTSCEITGLFCGTNIRRLTGFDIDETTDLDERLAARFLGAGSARTGTVFRGISMIWTIGFWVSRGCSALTCPLGEVLDPENLPVVGTDRESSRGLAGVDVGVGVKALSVNLPGTSVN